MCLQDVNTHPLFMSTRNFDRLGIGIFKTEVTSLNPDNMTQMNNHVCVSAELSLHILMHSV